MINKNLIKRDSKGRFVKGGNAYLFSGFKKGNITWSKDLTKETDERLKKASINQSKARQEGIKNGTIKIWNKDLTIEDPRVRKNTESVKKWRDENIKDKTYEEIYGKEEAERKIENLRIKNSDRKGEKNPMYGRNQTEEWSKQHGIIMKKLYKEGKIKINYRKGKDHHHFGVTPPFEALKKMSASLQGIPLEEWKGFVSKDPYDQNWTPKFRRAIRKRDNQVCMLCGIHREKLNKALCVHHMDGDKQMSIPQNCISLCAKCHLGIVHNKETKTKKEHWKKFFQDILSKHYDYQYSENGEVILEVNNQTN